MLSPEKYDLVVYRPYPPLLAGFIYHGYLRPGEFRPFLGRSFLYHNSVGIDGDWHYPSAQQKTLSRLTYSAWRKPKQFRWVVRRFRERERDLLRAGKSVNYQRYVEAFERYMPALAMTYVFEKDLERDVRLALRKQCSLAETDQLMHDLNIPLEDNYQRKEKFDLAKAKDIRAHARRYAWLLARYGGRKTYSAEMASRKRRSKAFLEEIAGYREQVLLTKRAIKKAKSCLDARGKHLIDVMQFIIFYRTQRTDVMNRSAYEFYPGFVKKGKELGVSYHDLLYMTPDEVKHHEIRRGELAQRKKGFALLIDDGVVRIADTKEYRKLRTAFQTDLTQEQLLQGSVASPGLVQGVAKIVLQARDLGKVRPGDILVATMTTPNFIPAMQRAVGFVTNEGGITCHAAIIARELKKPCVIGTKIATKVLKDGDRVEVDATRGIVKKL